MLIFIFLPHWFVPAHIFDNCLSLQYRSLVNLEAREEGSAVGQVKPPEAGLKFRQEQHHGCSLRLLRGAQVHGVLPVGLRSAVLVVRPQRAFGQRALSAPHENSSLRPLQFAACHGPLPRREHIALPKLRLEWT